VPEGKVWDVSHGFTERFLLVADGQRREDCLKRAIRKLNREDLSDLLIDRDTKSVPGMPDIGHTILEKIAKSAVVVADVTIINPAAVRRPDERPVSNPNVLFELGYAYRKLSPNAIIGVLNTASGEVEELPFDLWPKRLMTYRLAADDDKAEVRAKLVDAFAAAIRQCLGESQLDSHFNSPLHGKECLETLLSLQRFARIPGAESCWSWQRTFTSTEQFS
jgi:hypothetical protein